MGKIMSNSQFKKWMWAFLLAVAVIFAYKFIVGSVNIGSWLTSFGNIVSPFVVGLVIAYLLNMPCSMLRKKFQNSNIVFLQKRARGISILVVFLSFICLIIIGLSILIPAIYNTIAQFVTELPIYLEHAKEFMVGLQARGLLPQTLDINNLFSSGTAKKLFSVVLANLGDIVSAVGAIFSLGSYIFSAALALIATIYFLFESENFIAFFKRFFAAFFSIKFYEIGGRYAGNANKYFRSFFYCQILDAMILGTIATTILFVIGSDYALALGPMLGLFNIIPYFGAIIGTMITVVIVAFTDGFGTAGLALVLLLISQQIDGNVIQPKILGNSLSLSPLLIIISITVGGATAGVVGMVVAIPIVSLLKDVVVDFMEYRENAKLEKPPV